MTKPFTIKEDSKHFEAARECEDKLHHFTEVQPKTNKIGVQKFDVKFKYPGVFFFQFRYDECKFTDAQWIQIDPELRSGDKSVNINSLRILTVLARSLGKIDTWEDFIKSQKKLGYNTIHFTPIQEYGVSRSHYSLADQLNLDDWFFEDTSLTKEKRFNKLKSVIKNMQDRLGMIFFIDIVLNHTAENSEWIKSHPEATYNLENCPHLTCAYVLDKALTDFDIKFSKGK